MTLPDNGQPGQRLAVLHRAGGEIRALLGATVAPEILAWRTFSDHQADQIADWLGEQRVGSVLVVLPSAAVTCRTCTLPDADPEHLANALQLQAEAQMLTDVPPHRQAMAVLHAARGETSRSGIILAWPQVPGDPGVPKVPGLLEAVSREVTFTADVAALAALLNGERPADPLMWLDRADGSVAMAISHANGAVLRAARVGADVSAWTGDVGRALAETALSVGHTPAFTEALVNGAGARLAGVERGEAALFLPQELPEALGARAPGAPDDTAWWRAYGIALGAYVATTAQLAPLTRLRQAPPVVAPSMTRRLVDALSSPANTITFVAACLLLAMLTPLVAAALRLAVLTIKLPDLDTYLADARQGEVELAVYRELQKHAWPMTKLLSDIACNTPQDIDVDQIRIRHGDRLTIGGRVKPDAESGLSAQEVIALMQDDLRASNIFEEIYLNWGDPNAFGAYEFNLSAKVARPYHRHDYPLELDYDRLTLADRLYGDGLPSEGEADVELGGDEPEAAETRRARGERRVPVLESSRFSPGAEDVESRGTSRLPGSGGTLPPSQDIPEVLTPEQIAAMTLPEAQEAWARVAHALRRGVVDSDTRTRLRDEFRQIRDRIRELKDAEGDKDP